MYEKKQTYKNKISTHIYFLHKVTVQNVRKGPLKPTNFDESVAFVLPT